VQLTALGSKFSDHALNLRIAWIESCQLIRMGECRREVTTISLERNQGCQNIPISRVPLVNAFQHNLADLDRARGMEQQGSERAAFVRTARIGSLRSERAASGNGGGNKSGRFRAAAMRTRGSGSAIAFSTAW
jgi:hypothetical protein